MMLMRDSTIGNDLSYSNTIAAAQRLRPAEADDQPESLKEGWPLRSNNAESEETRFRPSREYKKPMFSCLAHYVADFLSFSL